MTHLYRYSFDDETPLEDVESALVLTIMAVEALHGESHARLDASHFLDRDERVCVVDGGSEVGMDFNKILVGNLSREFGPDGFRVQRIETPLSQAMATTTSVLPQVEGK